MLLLFPVGFAEVVNAEREEAEDERGADEETLEGDEFARIELGGGEKADDAAKGGAEDAEKRDDPDAERAKGDFVEAGSGWMGVAEDEGGDEHHHIHNHIEN